MRTFLRATISLRFFRLRALNTSLQNNSYHEHKVELSKMADWTVYKPEGSLANFNHPFVFVDIMAERVVQEVFTHYNYAITSVLKCVLAKKRQSRTKPRCPPYAGKMKVTGSQFPGWEEAKNTPSQKSTHLPSKWRLMTSLFAFLEKRVEIFEQDLPSGTLLRFIHAFSC